MQPESFSYVLVANLNDQATEEVPRTEIFRNFGRIANHIKAIYFYFLGYGPYHGRFFGGSMPFKPAQGPPVSLEAALQRTKLLQGAGMTPPLPLDDTGAPMPVRLHVFFKCEPSGSTDAAYVRDGRSLRDGGLEEDWLGASKGLRPELAQCLGETNERPHASSYRHRWCVLCPPFCAPHATSISLVLALRKHFTPYCAQNCVPCSLNDLPFEGWPLRGPQSAIEAAREDALSRRLRTTLQRPMLLATQAAGIRALSAADAAAAAAQLSALHGFAFAARNSRWANGNLPIIFQLQYVPRECGRPVRTSLEPLRSPGRLVHTCSPGPATHTTRADHRAAHGRGPLGASGPRTRRPLERVGRCAAAHHAATAAGRARPSHVPLERAPSGRAVPACSEGPAPPARHASRPGQKEPPLHGARRTFRAGVCMLEIKRDSQS